jgi:hypothetical protein
MDGALTAWFESGRAIDVVLAVFLLEALWLVLSGRMRALAVAAALLPGAVMVLALRVVVADGSWLWVALLLTVAFPVHLADLVHRGVIGRGRAARSPLA